MDANKILLTLENTKKSMESMLLEILSEQKQLESELAETKKMLTSYKQAYEAEKQESSRLQEENHKLMIENNRKAVKITAMESSILKLKNELDSLKDNMGTVQQDLGTVKQVQGTVNAQISQLQRHTEDRSVHRNNLTEEQRNKGVAAVQQKSRKNLRDVVQAIEHYVYMHCSHEEVPVVDMSQMCALLGLSDSTIRDAIKKVVSGEVNIPRQQGLLSFWRWIDSGAKFKNYPNRH